MTQDRQTTRARSAPKQKAATQAEAALNEQATAAPETLTTTAADDIATNTEPTLDTVAAPAPTPGPPTKGTQLLAMLAAPAGATLAGLCQALGWQARTMRAALTWLRHARHAVERSQASEGETVFRIIPGQPNGAAGVQQAEQAEATPVGEAEATTPAPLAPETRDGGDA